MSRIFKIGEAAKILGVSIQILRRWEEAGSLTPHHKSKGKTRYYSSEQLIQEEKEEQALTLAYARVSSHDRKEDLERQAIALGHYLHKTRLGLRSDSRFRIRDELSQEGSKT